MGWYHTHPGHTAYYSVTDIATHQRNFSKPHQVGIVIDPMHEDMGVYGLYEDGYVEKSFIIVDDGELVEERFDLPSEVEEEEEEEEEMEFDDEEMDAEFDMDDFEDDVGDFFDDEEEMEFDDEVEFDEMEDE